MLMPLLRASVVLIATIATTAFAAESHRCAQFADPAERLACYDAEFPPVAGAASLESRREQELRDFGLNQLQRREKLPKTQRMQIPDRIEATVASVRNVSSGGERSVTLDNGQVWMLTEANSKGYLRAGDKVVVREAAMGTYMLVTPNRIALRAKRIQ